MSNIDTTTEPATYTDGISAAKAYAAACGITGRKGGWLYTWNGRPICQGWAELTGRLVRHHVIRDAATGDTLATRSDDPEGRRNVWDGTPVTVRLPEPKGGEA